MWPAYAPWGAGSIGLFSPLPCFGCNWDCIFDRGVCVEQVPLEEVSKALDEVMTRPPLGPESRMCGSTDPRLLEIVRGATSKFRVIQDDRAQRLEAIFDLSATGNRQKQAIERLEAEKRTVDSVCETQRRAIADLERTAAERLDALVETDAALREVRAEAELREKGLQELTGVIETQRQAIADLERMAAERLDALVATDGALREVRTEADLREKGLHELTAVIETQRQAIADLERMAAERLDALLATDAALREARRGLVERIFGVWKGLSRK